MCVNATRTLIWKNVVNLDLSPLLSPMAFSDANQTSVTLHLKLHQITNQEDYRVIDAFKIKNISLVLDLIAEHRGINAIDEWGNTALMLAVQQQDLNVVAGLLNARLPKVNINTPKSV